MTTVEFLRSLRPQGVTVTFEPPDSLVVAGPEAVLTVAVCDELKARKSELRAADVAGAWLQLFRHGHACSCGRRFDCTAPACAGEEILCVCCRLDEIGCGDAERAPSARDDRRRSAFDGRAKSTG